MRGLLFDRSGNFLGDLCVYSKDGKGEREGRKEDIPVEISWRE